MPADADTSLSGLDLSQLAEADRLIAEAALRLRAEAIHGRMAPLLEKLEPATREIVGQLVTEIARAGLQAEAARQAVEASQRSREAAIRLDPLRYIPGTRVVPRVAPPASVVIQADAEDFTGTGWYEAERSGHRAWRWSGRNGNYATLLVPSLGGGRLRIALHLMMPFGGKLDLGATTLLANAVALPLRLREGSHAGAPVLEAEHELPEDHGTGSLALVLISPPHRQAEQPGQPVTDRRALGPGLVKAEIERIATD